MASRILMLILLSPTVVFYVQDNEPGIHAGPSRAPLTVTAAGEENEGFLCGECPYPEPGSGGDRQHGTFCTVSSTRETAAARGGMDVSPRHGLGPVLSALFDSLILSRPPPPAPGRS